MKLKKKPDWKQKKKKQQVLKELEEQKKNDQLNVDFLNKLEEDFKKSINNPKIKKVLLEGKEVSKKDALKLSVFDVETSIITYDKISGDGTLEIKLSKNKTVVFH